MKALEAALPESRVIRAMPNTPTLVGAGMAALAPGATLPRRTWPWPWKSFAAVGRAVMVEERLLDAVTGLSGSGPAYVAVFIEALTNGGVKMGLPWHLALLLATQTVIGAARLCLEEGMHPGVLKDLVTSPRRHHHHRPPYPRRRPLPGPGHERRGRRHPAGEGIGERVNLEGGAGERVPCPPLNFPPQPPI